MASIFDSLKPLKAWVGLDGFIDKIMLPVKTRTGSGNDFQPYASLKDFGQKIQNSSGINTNVELVQKIEKLGGNGPLLANALLNFGLDVRYVGSLGIPVHPLFQKFAEKTRAISLGNYGETNALEFEDGKLILGNTCALEQITYERFCQFVSKNDLINIYSKASLMSWQNWTMVIHMTEILSHILDDVWPEVEDSDDRICFFDLADPAKRMPNEVREFLSILPNFRNKGKVYLGVNRSEAAYISHLFGLDIPKVINSDACVWVRNLQRCLNLDGIIMHCREGAIAAVRNEVVFETAQVARKLICLTGSGDHFNAGCLCGLLMHLPLEQCLRLGHITSVLYIESGQTPALESIKMFYLETIK